MKNVGTLYTSSRFQLFFSRSPNRHYENILSQRLFLGLYNFIKYNGGNALPIILACALYVFSWYVHLSLGSEFEIYNYSRTPWHSLLAVVIQYDFKGMLFTSSQSSTQISAPRCSAPVLSSHNHAVNDGTAIVCALVVGGLWLESSWFVYLVLLTCVPMSDLKSCRFLWWDTFLMYVIIWGDKIFGITLVGVAHGQGTRIGILSVCLFGLCL